MSVSSNSPTLPQTPEAFTAYLRARTEEAVAASVHHASLSQQYLTLSQKFAALAEQAASGQPVSLVHAARSLEQEALTGTPSAPIGVPQVSVPPGYSGGGSLSSPVSAVASVAPAGSVMPAGSTVPAGSTENDTRQKDTAFFSPPARFREASFPGGASGESLPPDSAKPVAEFPGDLANEPSAAGFDRLERPMGTGMASAKVAVRKAARRPVPARKIVERARRVTLDHTERVRVRAKKSDLKPQLRTTTEEIKEELKRSWAPGAISMFVIFVALVILALKHLEYFEEARLMPIVAGFSDAIEEVEETLPVEPPAEVDGEQQEEPVEDPIEEMVEEPEPEPEPVPEVVPEVETAEVTLPETPDGTVLSSPDATAGAADNRSEAGRKLLLEKFGGSAASESAVGFALEWLAARQRANGTWDFNDVGPCTHRGSVNNPIGGTAYALLPFLAAGQTHKEGQYRRQVQAGLEFLMSIGIRVPAGYDLRGVVNKADDDTDPNYAYYVHGAATLALCEAYGMTKDRKLKTAAEGAVLFLLNSQDPRGGGWRYNPQQPGSTSATAIQVMALKAAEKAGIRIPGATWKGVSHYLDSVSIDREGRYGYEVEKKFYAISVTSMAMLSRMYLGWGRDDGDLRAGVALIDKKGPYDNLYYNYFATQVMKNWGGEEWDRWNGRLRDDLVAWQEKDGPAKGSWTPKDRADYSQAGGRLLTTCLATLTLEVYYRYKPILPDGAATTLTADSLSADSAGTTNSEMTTEAATKAEFRQIDIPKSQ